MKATGIILLLLVWHSGFSQWTDDFGDGNFEFDPTWYGDTAKYKVEDFSLRLSAPAANGSAYLSTPSKNINNASWQISVKLDFNPSTNNYVKLYLVANNLILNEALDGYYVQLGGAKDEVSL